MPVRRGARVIIYNTDTGKVLVENVDNKNIFDLPGGKLEPGEFDAECAFREVKEETGINLKSLFYLGMMSYIYETDPSITFKGSLFISFITYNDLAALEELNGNSIHWITLEELYNKVQYIDSLISKDNLLNFIKSRTYV